MNATSLFRRRCWEETFVEMYTYKACEKEVTVSGLVLYFIG